MFNPFITRKPWAASVIGLLFSPTVGMLYLGKGKWAVGYVGITLAVLACPFALTHFELYPSDPRPLAEIASWVLQIAGAAHCCLAAKHQTGYATKWFSRWYNILLLVFVVPLTCSFTFRTFFYEPFDIPGTSMEPTLKQGDFIFVSKQAYKSGNLPQRNDVVVFSVVVNGERSSYVKRIVGMPGDKVRIEGDKVFINEEAIGSRYPESDTERLRPHQLADGQYFVVGDNPYQSHDSRNGLGDVMLNNIIGKPVAVVWNFKTHKFAYQPVR